jgi:hypothetical protein
LAVDCYQLVPAFLGPVGFNGSFNFLFLFLARAGLFNLSFQVNAISAPKEKVLEVG